MVALKQHHEIRQELGAPTSEIFPVSAIAIEPVYHAPLPPRSQQANTSTTTQPTTDPYDPHTQPTDTAILDDDHFNTQEGGPLLASHLRTLCIWHQRNYCSPHHKPQQYLPGP